MLLGSKDNGAGVNTYILRGHTPVIEDDLLTWARWFEEANRVVKCTILRSGVEVSTTFVGLDHAPYDGLPLLFETMIFGGLLNRHTKKYNTWQGSKRGSKMLTKEKAIELLKRGEYLLEAEGYRYSVAGHTLRLDTARKLIETELVELDKSKHLGAYSWYKWVGGD